MRTRLLTAVLISLSLAVPAVAQTLRRDTGPANFPPRDYQGSQFVDNRGCVYIRAGFAGVVNWVPRVDRSRRIVCGLQPTVPAASETQRTAPGAATRPVAAAAPRAAGRVAAGGVPAFLSRTPSPAPAPTILSTPGAAVSAPQHRFAAAPAAQPLRATIIRGAVLRIEGPPASVPKGYRPVFEDGRHNLQRGLPDGASALAPARR
jgi:hypothetical protein